MLFTFPEDAHWNAEQQAVEFGVEIGEYLGVTRERGAHSSLSCPWHPAPSHALRAYYLQRIRFESIVERNLHPRQLTEDGGP